MNNYSEILNKLSSIRFVGLSFNVVKYEKTFKKDQYIIIGQDYENEVGIRKADSEVFSLSNEGKVFINSSLLQLLNCIEAFNSVINFDDEYDDDKRKEEVSVVKNKINKIDTVAIAKNNWWWYILEQCRDGVL